MPIRTRNRSSFARFTLHGPALVRDEDTISGDVDGDVDMTMSEEGRDEVMQDGTEQEDESDISNEQDAQNQNEYDLPSNTDRLIIAIDFGTTFSSVAYTKIKKGERPSQLTLQDVKCIDRYPDYRPSTSIIPPLGDPHCIEDVPTELWYDPNSQRVSPSRESPAELDDENDTGHRWVSLYPSSDEDEELEEQEEPEKHNNEQRHRERSLETSRPQYWGFGVQNQLRRMDIPKNHERRVTRFKLLLDKSKETAEVRRTLDPIMKALKKRRLISQYTDTITHYLTHLLENTKNQLTASGELEHGTPIEFVLCVPAKWPTRGSRVMQSSIKQAVKDAGLGEQTDDGVSDLFIVSEPEAAAACVLSENKDDVYFGEVIVVLDAGGGTVDAVTYEVTNQEPLRMQSEVVQPDSELCGASYMNERFETLLYEKLKNERYLEVNGKTIKSIVEAQGIIFENGEKRTIDTTSSTARLEPIWIDNLRADRSRGLYQNRVEISQDDVVKGIFRDSLRGTKELLKRQLQRATDKEKSVVKVILTGGFGQSIALQNYLKKKLLNKERNFGGNEIDLLIPRTPSTAVARGAVLRALRKDQGPKRISQCSYGFLITEPYEPEIYEAHAKTKCRIDKSDGEKYVDGTIRWLIKMGDIVEHRAEFSIEVKHTFPLGWLNFICKEELYVSDQRHKSHYRKSHVNNKEAELVGCIIADMTFLKTEGRIKPEEPSESSTYSNNPQKLYWAVHFELVMVVEGRNLRYEARWPLSKDLKEGERQGIHAKGQVSIAAAFQPGTA